ncbi:hypothetical protein CPLU01_06671 [Colletotrichum plurivorum]|uniref:Aconitase X catalytic domain-containing protein n=1 Tax=Colletotrichum plurivorum TaxID=2175906 RepID=A0A8H6NFH0_9PEZI|nr:hypothetical protein CPLU01_06671 [Colletotrichum plurivorum]
MTNSQQGADTSALFTGDVLVRGSTTGTLLASDTELSLWGGVHPQTGEIIDRHHPLSGRFLHGSVLVIPSGRGSCAGSGVMLETLLNGKGPRAVLFERREEIITLGVIVAMELFDKHIPVVVLSSQDFRWILTCDGSVVSVDGEHVRVQPPSEHSAVLEHVSFDKTNKATETRLDGEVFHVEDDLEVIISDIKLSSNDQAALDGSYGDATRAVMRIVLRMAHLLGAEELMDVSQVHVDSCFYTGPGSLAFAEKLRDLGGKVAIPTTMNAISVDERQWRALGVDESFGEASARLAKAYVEMGARPTFTCAPYQLDSAPRKGDQIAWAESNAVVYANSVLGAKTMKYPDYLDIAIALTGRAPKAGAHIDRNRLATMQIKIPRLKNDIDDSFYPVLGYVIGTLAVTEIPVVSGLEALAPTKDDLKAFGAAFATTSSAFMFHIVGVTPEASTLEAVSPRDNGLRCVDLQPRELEACWEQFNSAPVSSAVDLVSLGNPHFSLSEIRRLTELCRGRTKHPDVKVVVTCSRTTQALASQAGLIEPLEDFGVQFVTDTCWCMVIEPIIPPRAKVIMTNSGKYAHYGPGLTGRRFRFGSLAMCVDAACWGIDDGKKPAWL